MQPIACRPTTSTGTPTPSTGTPATSACWDPEDMKRTMKAQAASSISGAVPHVQQALKTGTDVSIDCSAVAGKIAARGYVPPMAAFVVNPAIDASLDASSDAVKPIVRKGIDSSVEKTAKVGNKAINKGSDKSVDIADSSFS